jgi:hypothetical protein
MLEPKTIYAGSSIDLATVGHVLSDGTLADLSAGYTCAVKVYGGGIDRAVTTLVADDAGNPNRKFLVALNSGETTAIAADTYTYTITIANAAAGFRQTDEGKLTVLTLPSSEPAELTQLKSELAQVRAARIVYLTGGVVQKVRNGRYATEMWYASAKSLAEYDALIQTLEREIAAFESVAAGGRARSAIVGVW